jgi:hypothetical protein
MFYTVGSKLIRLFALAWEETMAIVPRVVRLALAASVMAGALGCGLLPFGGGAAAWKPTEVMNNQFPGDLSAAKEGQWLTYVTEAAGNKTSQTVKIVGKSGNDVWVEHWMDMGTMAYGSLYKIGGDKKISKAYAAAKDEKEWTEIKVNEPPKPPQGGDAPKPQIKESDEKKEVKAGAFSSHRTDVTMNISGKDYKSTTWFSKDVPKIYMGGEHGGMVAMETENSKTWLDAKGEDGKATLPLPK